jgi:hypothetical protein
MPVCTVESYDVRKRRLDGQGTLQRDRYIANVQPTWCTMRFCLANTMSQRFICPPHHNKEIAYCELSCLSLPLLTPGRRRLPTNNHATHPRSCTSPASPDKQPHPPISLYLSHGHLTDRSGRSASNQQGAIPLCRLVQKGRGGLASVLEYEGRAT